MNQFQEFRQLKQEQVEHNSAHDLEAKLAMWIDRHLTGYTGFHLGRRRGFRGPLALGVRN